MPNPFEDDSDEELDSPGDSKNFADLRKAYNREVKARKTESAELEELRTFRQAVTTEKREAVIQAAFTEVGLSAQHAKLFKAINPDVDVSTINAETVGGFAKEYGLGVASGEEDVDVPAPKPEGFSPVVSGQAAPLARKMARDEWLNLHTTDPARARQLFEQGKVDTSEIDKLSMG